jgi:hypothetical protein
MHDASRHHNSQQMPHNLQITQNFFENTRIRQHAQTIRQNNWWNDSSSVC